MNKYWLKVKVKTPPSYEEIATTAKVSITNIQSKKKYPPMSGYDADKGWLCDEGFTLIEVEWRKAKQKPVVILLDKDTTVEVRIPDKAPIDPKASCFYGKITDKEGNPQEASILVRPINATYETDEDGEYRTDNLKAKRFFFWKRKYQVIVWRKCQRYIDTQTGWADGYTDSVVLGWHYLGNAPREVNHQFGDYPKNTRKPE